MHQPGWRSWCRRTSDVYYTTIHTGQCFLVTEDGEDSAAGPSQCTYLRSQVHKRVLNAAEGWRLREKKQISQPTVEAKRATEEQGKVQK